MDNRIIVNNNATETEQNESVSVIKNVTIAESEKKLLAYKIEKAALIDYTLNSYIILFFTFSFVGWLYEVVLFIVLQQEFINTGILYGPWLPIYGIGGVCILELFKNLRYSPIKTFVSIFISSGILEYTAHAASEAIFNITWWDYSDYIFNINGRICLEALTVFAILGCFSVYCIAPKINEIIINKYPKGLTRLQYIIIVIFVLDMIVSIINPNVSNTYGC